METRLSCVKISVSKTLILSLGHETTKPSSSLTEPPFFLGSESTQDPPFGVQSLTPNGRASGTRLKGTYPELRLTCEL